MGGGVTPSAIQEYPENIIVDDYSIYYNTMDNNCYPYIYNGAKYYKLNSNEINNIDEYNKISGMFIDNSQLHDIYTGDNINNFIDSNHNNYGIFRDNNDWWSHFDGFLLTDTNLINDPNIFAVCYEEFLFDNHDMDHMYLIKLYTYNNELYIKYNNVFIFVNEYHISVKRSTPDYIDFSINDIVYNDNLPDFINDSSIYVPCFCFYNRFRNIINYYKNNNYTNSFRIINNNNAIYSEIEPIEIETLIELVFE